MTAAATHLRAYVSLWSADLLALREAVDLIADDADGLHIDVFDAHSVEELLFGPDVVAALRAHTDALIDVHLNVTDLELWVGRFVAAGADMVTVPVAGCRDPAAMVDAIHELGARAGLALGVDDSLEAVLPFVDAADRVLIMGTRLGIKGVDLHPQTPGRVRALARARAEVVVDGGIRRHTVPLLVEAGADGVVPGSMVFSAPDPRAAVAWIQQRRR